MTVQPADQYTGSRMILMSGEYLMESNEGVSLTVDASGHRRVRVQVSPVGMQVSEHDVTSIDSGRGARTWPGGCM
jgi:hypothetical protein